MNFRERYLGGLFVRNKYKVETYKSHQDIIEQKNDNIAKIDREFLEISDRIKSLASEFLSNQMKASEAKVTLQRIYNLKEALDQFLAKLKYALTKVGEAQDMENIDLAFDNTGASVLSTMRNNDANGAIEEARKFSEIFVQQLNSVDGLSKIEYKDTIDADLDDNLDLAMDVCLDLAVDTMSYFSLQNLNKAASQLRQVISQVIQINNSISEQSLKTLVSYLEIHA